ncbi:hypothetical protein B0H17DRAFT_1135983 [Mycena rosella]|uniref:Uncharacterized protein n=1 Tax=Mycena rosella TaxID=1033263 RepID=A0AAD7DBJ7_MYCRO|nr:hypothetical protein B0H17DRAFT_1135983 [Mycena rosella]
MNGRLDPNLEPNAGGRNDVCQTWHQISVQLLYEHVTLRRLGQIPAFIRALEARNGLGALVRSLDINCLVPPRFYAAHGSNTQKIFQLCPRMSHFGFSPTKDPLGRLDKPQCLFPVSSDSITSLRLNDEFSYYFTIFPLLIQIGDRLRSLTLSLRLVDVVTKHPTLIFGHLEDLHLLFDESSASVILKWSMPRLRRVCLHRPYLENNSAITQPVLELLKLCGGTVMFLSLFRTATLWLEIQQALDQCHALDHLALNDVAASTLLKRQTLTKVDIFDTFFPRCRLQQFQEEAPCTADSPDSRRKLGSPVTHPHILAQ